ncbi:MAG: hypothetical protein ACXVZH_02130 [Terriglobales bacterium]
MSRSFREASVEAELPADPPPDSARDPEAVSESATEQTALVPAVVPAVVVLVLPEAPAYRDRGTGLVIFGVLQIILGLLAALMVPLVALGAFMSRLAPGGAMRPGQFISGVASYAFLAAALIGLGIGSVQMKRWARALTLVTSWYWLITGALVTVLLTAALPVTMRSALAQAQQNAPAGPSPAISTGVMAVILTLIIIFAAVFLVLVPIAFVVFYGRTDVAETCRHRDPIPRWTDRTPLPVLGASVVLALGALYLLLIGVTTPIFPFFGKYLSGIAGSVCFIVTAALDTYLAVALFRLQTSGWWIAAVTMPLRFLSMVLTYARADLMQAYSKMGMSDAQLKVLSANPMLRGRVFLWWGLSSMVLLFGYLLWLKRYFKTPASEPADALQAQAS